MRTLSEPLDVAVPEASHLWTSQFHEPVISPFCESHFQLGFSITGKHAGLHQEVKQLAHGLKAGEVTNRI